MKRIIATSILTIASFIAAGEARAADHEVEATVPFDFAVGNHVLHSGIYRIGANVGSNMIEIRSRDGQASVIAATLGDYMRPAKGGELVFDRYGNQYFLSEVLCPAASINVKLPISKMEKKVRVQNAMLHSSSQTLVAIK